MSATPPIAPAPADSADAAWQTGPARPRLPPGALHVWRADLARAGEHLHELLSEDERARAAGILGERERRLWMASRGALRLLLARYLQVEPAALRLARGPHGKPELALGATESTVAPGVSSGTPAAPSFNLSHSEELALFAFGEGEVGVDVEGARPALDVLAIAERALGSEEARRVEALEPALRQRRFLRAWTRREAELKCLGVGLGAASSAAQRPRPYVLDLDVGPRESAAVACERPPTELCCWDLAL